MLLLMSNRLKFLIDSESSQYIQTDFCPIHEFFNTVLSEDCYKVAHVMY